MTTTEELSPRIVLMSTIGVVAVMLLAALDGTIVGTAMPRVIAELQGFQHYAAVTTTYMLAATVVVPIVGKLSDMYGRKPFLLAGVAVFVGGYLGETLRGLVGGEWVYGVDSADDALAFKLQLRGSATAMPVAHVLERVIGQRSSSLVDYAKTMMRRAGGK